MKRRLPLLMLVLLISTCAFTPGARALSIGFSDQDFLGGASWGTMTIDALDSNTLMVRYDAAPDTVIPAGSEATGFGFSFAVAPASVWNPGTDNFIGDRDDLDWIVLNNLDAFPNPANGDEFNPAVTKADFTFGVTEGNANNLNPPGIEPGEFDVFYLDFNGVDFGSTDLDEFVNLTGVRLQSLPDNINTGSLFLVGGGEDDDGGFPVPEPGTISLLGSGLIGLAALRKSAKA